MRFSLIFLSLVTAFAQSPLQLLKQDVPAPDHRLSYGPTELNYGELRLPKGPGPHPIVILLHGGCWKAQIHGLDPRATSLDLLRPIAAALTDSGLATWNVEYRRSGNPGGGWPGTFHDIGESIDFLRTISEKHSLNLRRVIILGHSSGGQLAFWAAARPKLPQANSLYKKEALPIFAAIDLDGPLDLKGAEPYLEKHFCGPVIREFLGGSPDEYPDRYAAASANAFLPLGVRQEIIVGALLAGIKEQVSVYEDEARSKGDDVHVVNLEEAGHFGFLFPESKHWETVKDRIRAVLADSRR